VSSIANFNLAHLLDLTVGAVVAFVLATLIGAERQWRQRSAGLRTNGLVAVGAAAFVSLGVHLNGNAGATQIAAYVVSSIGFLGAGVIMKEGAHVWGLNTAATLWCSGAVGALSGAGLPAEAAALTVAVLAGDTLLRPLVNVIDRAPLDEQRSERLTRSTSSPLPKLSARSAIFSPRRWKKRSTPSVRSKSRSVRPRRANWS
jgi:putative Mg2+ transporter-C (MgtC) family protein